MPSEYKLSPQEKRIRGLLMKRSDTSIKTLFLAAKGTRKIEIPAARKMQQAVGAVICTMNKKIAADGVVARVGKARFTYRLYPLSSP